MAQAVAAAGCPAEAVVAVRRVAAWVDPQEDEEMGERVVEAGPPEDGETGEWAAPREVAGEQGWAQAEPGRRQG